MKKPLRICYHGTLEVNAVSILETGFRIGTYFAYHLEDAIGYGNGKAGYVLEVVFPDDQMVLAAPRTRRQGDDAWQFQNAELVPPERIVASYRVEKTTYRDNPELRESVFRSTPGGGT